jgi:probable DNA repair protein
LSTQPKSKIEPTTLTVNSRLSRWLLLEHNEKQKRAGLKAWPTPEILPFNSWLGKIWLDSWPDRVLLKIFQVKTLWLELIRSDPRFKSLSLLDLGGAAEKAAEAYQQIRKYDLPVTSSLFPLTEEGQAFLGWKRAYDKKLRAMNAIDPVDLIDNVREGMAKGRIPTPPCLTLAGFEEITPQMQRWVDFLQNQATALQFNPEISEAAEHSLKDVARDKSVEVRCYDQSKEEAIQCARFVRSHFKPGQTFGIVVPDLKNYQSLLKREFTAELAPNAISPWTEENKPFNISLGTPLTREPMVQVALNFLQADSPVVPLTLIASIIKSPFLKCGREDFTWAQEQELRWRKFGMLKIDLHRMEDFVPTPLPERVKQIADAWTNTIGNNKLQLPGQWAVTFTEILKQIGWPSEPNNLSIKDTSVVDTWNKSLDEFASLDRFSQKLSRRAAAEKLAALLEETQFQEKTGEQPIQIVGLLESSGMRFDYLWVMGCHRDVLPSPPAPNPFLPAELRRQFNLPHANAERELQFAQHSIRRLIESAKEVVFSYPAWQGSTELAPSPLLKEFVSNESAQETRIVISHRTKDRFEKSNILEPFKEPEKFPIAGAETELFISEDLRGGYSVLKDQAACPFRAFATHRMGAVRADLPEVDHDLADRGTLVHLVLELFWGKTQSRKKLQQLVENNQLETVVENCVRTAMKKRGAKIFRQNSFMLLEAEQVSQLVMEWLLDVEMQRDDFKVISEEKQESISIAGLRLKLRIDRIDQTPEGKILLIDYKTGNIRAGDWFGSRIQEPQLPLYASHLNPDAIAFAQIKRGQLNYTAASDPGISLSGIKAVKFQKHIESDRWADLLTFWRDTLTTTAQNFYSGHHAVDPFKGRATCKYCDLQTLCRVEETNIAEIDEDE